MNRSGKLRPAANSRRLARIPGITVLLYGVLAIAQEPSLVTTFPIDQFHNRYPLVADLYGFDQNQRVKAFEAHLNEHKLRGNLHLNPGRVTIRFPEVERASYPAGEYKLTLNVAIENAITQATQSYSLQSQIVIDPTPPHLQSFRTSGQLYFIEIRDATTLRFSFIRTELESNGYYVMPQRNDLYQTSCERKGKLHRCTLDAQLNEFEYIEVSDAAGNSIWLSRSGEERSLQAHRAILRENMQRLESRFPPSLSAGIQ